MTARHRLPDRRPSETFDLEHAHMRYTVTISRDHLRVVREAFICNHKRGNASDIAARDCGILISLVCSMVARSKPSHARSHVTATIVQAASQAP
jgi:hypothetical protein